MSGFRDLKNNTVFIVILSNLVVAFIMSSMTNKTMNYNTTSSESQSARRVSSSTSTITNNHNNNNNNSIVPPMELIKNNTIEEILAIRERHLSRESCEYKPIVPQKEGEDDHEEGTKVLSEAEYLKTFHPYEKNPSNPELTMCKEAIKRNWSFNHLPSSSEKMTKFRRYPTYQYDALVKSTYCAANPTKLQTQQKGKCFQNNYFDHIARIPAPQTAEEFKEYALRALPVIFTGYQPDHRIWTWTVDNLAEEVGHYEMKVRHGNYDDLASRQFTTMTVGDFVDIIRGRKPRPQGMPPYLGNNKIFTKLMNELGYSAPPYFERGFYQFPSLWVGPAGTETPLHKDGPDNFAFMIQGTKRWTIFPPEDLYTLDCTKCIADKYVDVEVGGNLMNGLCWCVNEGVVRDGDTLPSSSQPYTFDLNEGEILYLPAGWLHSVQNLDDTVMINQWMKYHLTPQSVWGQELIQFWARGEYGLK